MRFEERDVELLRACLKARTPYEAGKMLPYPTSSIYRRVKRLIEKGFLKEDLAPTPQGCEALFRSGKISESEYLTCLKKAWGVEVDEKDIQSLIKICNTSDPWKCLMTTINYLKKEYLREGKEQMVAVLKLLSDLIVLIEMHKAECKGKAKEAY